MNPLDTDPIAQVAAGDLDLDSSSQLTKFESLAPSFKEIVAGTDGSARRTVTYYILGWLIATAVRVACFNPLCVTSRSLAVELARSALSSSPELFCTPTDSSEVISSKNSDPSNVKVCAGDGSSPFELSTWLWELSSGKGSRV